jgi:hypothetical protein
MPWQPAGRSSSPNLPSDTDHAGEGGAPCRSRPTAPALSVLIVEADVDDHPDVGLAWGTEAVGDAIRTAALTHPDVVLVGAAREGRLDLDSIGDVRAAYPAARVVLVSPAADPERRALAISHEADAYVVNDDGGEHLRGELHARS